MVICSDSVEVGIGPYPESGNKKYLFSIKKTCHMINTEKSYHKVIFLESLPCFLHLLFLCTLNECLVATNLLQSLH